jgi:hypothetical protein
MARTVAESSPPDRRTTARRERSLLQRPSLHREADGADWHSGLHPASGVWFSTCTCSSVTPQTSGTLHTPLGSRARRFPPDRRDSAVEHHRGRRAGGRRAERSACVALSKAMTFRSSTWMSGGSRPVQLQAANTRGATAETSITWPTMTPYSEPDPSMKVRYPAS